MPSVLTHRIFVTFYRNIREHVAMLHKAGLPLPYFESGPQKRISADRDCKGGSTNRSRSRSKCSRASRSRRASPALGCSSPKSSSSASESRSSSRSSERSHSRSSSGCSEDSRHSSASGERSRCSSDSTNERKRARLE